MFLDCGHSRNACKCALVVTGLEESLGELEFQRSACGAAHDGDVEKLARILQRNPSAVHATQGTGSSQVRV